MNKITGCFIANIVTFATLNSGRFVNKIEKGMCWRNKGRLSACQYKIYTVKI